MDMEAGIKGLIADVDRQLSEVQDAIALAQRQSIERMAALLSRRDRLIAVLSEVSLAGASSPSVDVTGTAEGREALPKEQTVQPSSPQGPLRPTASEFILTVLSEAGPVGLSGSQLQGRATEAGLTKGAVDKARTRLRSNRKIRSEDGKWFVASSPDDQSRAA
jgi:hypothetical protein